MKGLNPRPILLLAVLLVGCVDGPSNGFPEISVGEPWVRAMPFVSGEQEASSNSAVYLVLRNRGRSGDRLTGAETDAADAVQIHETRVVDDVMRMREVGSLEIPPNDSVRLEPGALHLMLLGLTRPLRNGEELELKLHFEKAGDLAVRVPVRSMTGG